MKILKGALVVAGLTLLGCGSFDRTERNGIEKFVFGDGTQRYYKSREFRCDYNPEGELTSARSMTEGVNCIYVGFISALDRSKTYCKVLESDCDNASKTFNSEEMAIQ